jgi:hypothetical protein
MYKILGSLFFLTIIKFKMKKPIKKLENLQIIEYVDLWDDFYI